jgi:Fe-S-cluster containining protein
MSTGAAPAGSQAASPCQSCGACCSYDAKWPRFTLEDDAAIAQIPARLVAKSGSGMRCVGNRCSALHGKIGQATACTIYDIRPDVCRACEPGDDACNMARQHHGLGVLVA